VARDAVALDAIQDQPRAVELLRRALASDRVAHAYAFVGPPGSGRTATALAFAQALLCQHGGCGACRGCALVAARQHPDLHVIVPTPPEKNPRGPRAIRIDAIRELERRAALKPAVAPRAVFVLDDADRMTGETPEAILKTLEEPPARTVLILILPRARAVPATVLSRCQVVRFGPRGRSTADEDRAEAAAALAEVRAKGADALFRRSAPLDREKAEHFLDGCRLLLRDLLFARAGAAHLAAGDGGEALVRQAEEWTLEELLGGLDVCGQARAALALNVTPRLTAEVVLSRLAFGAP
jgi:DNA polymerase-3 subunit delta'